MNIKFGMSFILSAEKVDCAWNVAVPDNPVDELMNMSLSDEALISSGDKDDITVQMYSSEMNDLIAQKVDRVFAARPQAEALTQNKKPLVHMLQLGGSQPQPKSRPHHYASARRSQQIFSTKGPLTTYCRTIQIVG